MSGLGLDVVSVIGTLRGLTVGFLLLWHSVVCTVESLSFISLPFYISICT